MIQQYKKILEDKTLETASKTSSSSNAIQLKNNREYSVVQQKLAENSTAITSSFTPIQRKTNNTGLPDNLKSGIENLSGHSMDDVKVHYNSDKPAQLNAHAYAQGTDIHIASGQEKHLPHEAWHVVQQKQGRVKPTLQMKGKVNVNDDKGLEKEADVMGSKALQKSNINTKTTNLKSKLTPTVSSVVQPVWDNDIADDELKRSKNLPASQIVPENIRLQDEAQNLDQGQSMRESQKFSATGYEFEFAQLSPEAKETEFGKKSHMHLATGPKFPLYPGIPFMVETDMGAVIELAMPPLLIPRNPKSKQINKQWVTTVMLKLERGLKALARNSAQDLKSILKSVQTFFGLRQAFVINQDVEVTRLGARKAKYGHMQKNSRIKGKYTTAQANIVTTLEEAIKMAYNKEDLPAEIAEVKTLLDAKLKAIDGEDPKNYGIFVAQKLSEIPYMFMDTLHAKSLTEQASDEENKPTFDLLKQLAGHDTNKLEKNKIHIRNEGDGPDVTRYTARSVVSRVKGRGFGWIKSTLGQQVKLFSPKLIEATDQLLSDKDPLLAALQKTTAYNAIEKYSNLEGGENLITEFKEFVKSAVANMRNLLSKKTSPEDEQVIKNNTREQIANPDERHLISSARPDTVIYLNDQGAAYQQNEANDAVLVEIRHASKAFKIKYSDRTTNKASKKDLHIATRAKKELEHYNDKNWKKAYKEANPQTNTNKRINIEKEIFELLSNRHINAAYQNVIHKLKISEPKTDIFWKKWFEKTNLSWESEESEEPVKDLRQDWYNKSKRSRTGKQKAQNRKERKKLREKRITDRGNKPKKESSAKLMKSYKNGEY
ncbi:DUF4157 domain-containing protein [Flavobacterium sp. LHD-85]|uniref:eCIS core domain-containing protein n=1 Tax=Flavobacterium sp. LHD-85 TaxID=3071410 RepID=UPI0027E16868|nr:DUF4157 domain-containing protein [Flavobacterium sp. LHD-85]MDQ6530924.1 DUF4157 domain-containing protein [Flavobacterium sp. LHD-85]